MPSIINHTLKYSLSIVTVLRSKLMKTSSVWEKAISFLKIIVVNVLLCMAYYYFTECLKDYFEESLSL
jgi:flagellar biosynthesis protein FliQ